MIDRFIVLFAVSCCGCSGATLGSAPASRTSFSQADFAEVMNAGERTMREFFTVELVDREAGLIRSAPTAATADEALPTVGAGLSSPPELRKIAELEFSRRLDGVTAACRVEVQRNQVAETRPYLQQSSANDVPNQTPLEESLGLESGPGVLWTTVGRDRRLEQAVLAALRERLEND